MGPESCHHGGTSVQGRREAPTLEKLITFHTLLATMMVEDDVTLTSGAGNVDHGDPMHFKCTVPVKKNGNRRLLFEPCEGVCLGVRDDKRATSHIHQSR